MVESKEQHDRTKYSKSAMLHLLGLKKRMKAIKQMPALVAQRNASLLAQDRYNKEVNSAIMRKT
jgi:hypothetical protein